MRRRRRHALEADIPTSSTGDLAFLLIIFFMVTASFAVTRGLMLDLPRKERPEADAGDPSVLVEIRADGSVAVDCRPMDAGGILDYLEPRLRRNPRKPIVLYAHEGATYQALVAVYESLCRARDRGLEDPDINIPTPDDIEDYVRVFGYDPFATHCGGRTS